MTAVISISHLLQSSFLSESSILQSLGEEFNLCGNGNMIFHWSDFYETCDAIKLHLEQDPKLMEDYKRRELGLERLKQIPVWVRTNKRIHQSTMHELYEKYLLKQSIFNGVDLFGPLDMSFISGAGPFRAIAIAECFNNSTYKDFVLIYLLKNKLPRRDYRIRLKSKVLLEFGEDFGQAHLVQLEQLTSEGLLFSMDADFYHDHVAAESEIRFLIDTKILQQGHNKSIQDLRSHLSKYAFNLLYSARKEDSISCKQKDVTARASVDFFKNKKIYLFTPYTKLVANNENWIKNIQDFVLETKQLVRQHYCEKVKSKSA